MTTHIVTFSDESMNRSADQCYLSALTKGNVDRGFRFTPYDITRLRYYEQHRELFDAPRGCGYWSFKPALLHKLTDRDSFIYDVKNNDVLIWADAGIEFINNVNYIIDRMDQDIFLFGNNWEHAHWCKGDVLYELWRDARLKLQLPVPERGVATEDEMRMLWLRFGKQVQASVIFFRVSDYTRQFVKEWLDWCLFEGGRLIDDSPSRTPNHPEFREHRHDQAILTTLAYREGVKLHYWPASYNDGAFSYEKLPEYAGDDYPILFNHHRRRDHEWVKCA